MKNTLKFSECDHVAVALEPLCSGDMISVNGEAASLKAKCDIPMGHKIALCSLRRGDIVYKYGHPIGTATEDIEAGDYVHVHNLLDLISDWEATAKVDFTEGMVPQLDDKFLINDPPKLYGYKRADGSVGFRNYVLVLSTCVCSNQPVKELEFSDRDIVCIENPSGCLILPNEVERMNSLLLGLAKNPNVGAVIFVSLGCENINAQKLCDQMQGIKPAACFISQKDGSTEKTAVKLKEKAAEFKALLARQERVEVSIADIRLGTKCGASDWTTAAASNPAIGYCSDMIVKNGGISLLGETCGWFGGEQTLTENSRTRETAEAIIEQMRRTYRTCKFYGKSIEQGNPAPGNIAGGISTLKEKALGNIMKGGTAPIEGMLGVGEQPEIKGLFVCDNAGIDPASLFALTASSANILLYSTGRGSPVGSPLAPAIKLTASPTAAETYTEHMDVDLTDLVLEGVSIAEGGKRLFDEIISVANGKLCAAEQGRHREYAFPLMMGPM